MVEIRIGDFLYRSKVVMLKNYVHFKHEFELLMSASAGKRTRAACMTGEHATIEPPMQTFIIRHLLRLSPVATVPSSI